MSNPLRFTILYIAAILLLSGAVVFTLGQVAESRIYYGASSAIAEGDILSTHILDGQIVNADISGSAYIDFSKLATTTDNYFLVASGTVMTAKDATSSRAALDLTAMAIEASTFSNWSTAPQGGVPYASATGTYSILSAATSGYFLKTQGAGADPVFAPVPAMSVDVGDVVYCLNPAETTLNSASYVKKKESAVGVEGTFRIKFSILSNGGVQTVYGKIYRNGSPVGTERTTTSGTYVTFSEDISGWSSGDKVQLYTKAEGGVLVKSKDLNIYCDNPPQGGAIL